LVNGSSEADPVGEHDATPDDEPRAQRAAKHFDEPALAALVLHIAAINAWNRLNVTTGQERRQGNAPLSLLCFR